MHAPTQLHRSRGFRRMLTLCLLVAVAGRPATAQQRSEQKDIRSELQGDTQCVVSAKRWWLSWKQYNEAKDEAARAGDAIDQESMRWYADAERRTSWHVLEHDPGISVATGRVDGEENTRFGAIPPGADIQVGYQHDWKVSGRYGWGSHQQPRVESITEIQIDPDFEAIIEVENDIDFTAKASLSGTAGRRRPWPQIAEHDVTLIAVDVNGQQHTVRGRANATVTPTSSTTSTDGSSTTTSWSVNGSLGVSRTGPSGSIGGSYGQSTTESHSTTTGESVPTVPDQSYGPEMQYHHTTTRTFRVPCGGKAQFSRAAQISGNFFTRSLAPHGSVSSTGNFVVSNTAKITITCIPCEGSGGGEGDPDSDPTGGNPHDDEGGGRTGGNTPGGNHHGEEGGGSLDPVERDGVTYTPSFGDSRYPREFWDNPIVRAGGCIYIDPRSFGRFLPIPESQAGDLGPWAFEQNVLVPLVVPDHDDWTHVAVAHTARDVILRAFPGTPTSVLLGLNRVRFDGPFAVIDVESGAEHQFGPGFVEFAVGGAPLIEGTFQVRVLPGDELVTRMEGTRQILETFGAASEFPTSVAVVDELTPGVIRFEHSVYLPDELGDLAFETGEGADDADGTDTGAGDDEDPAAGEESPAGDDSPSGDDRPVPYRRADPNGDGVTDVSDAVWLLRWFFGQGTAPSCRKAGDANGDGALDVSDTVYTLLFLFRNGPPPPAPWESCGVDPARPEAPGDLGCEAYPACAE